MPRKPISAHMLELDTLRAFAVTAVLIHHYLPGGWGYGAAAGVRLFFVLSGFLITGILLRSKEEVEAEERTRGRALARFYARRFLRIFPLYYFVIGVAFIVNLHPVREIIGSLLTYTLNIHMARQGWYEANFAHFWSLSVEEQFYIFWPWLIVFLPQRWLKPVITLVILAGPTYRCSYVLSGYLNMKALATYISTVACFDALGLGSLLALLVANRGAVFQPKVIGITAMIFATGLAISFSNSDVRIILHDTAQAGLFACVIAVVPGAPGVSGRILRWPPFLYIGKISYGIYVYHPFMPKLLASVFLAIDVVIPKASGVNSALYALATLACASISWFFLEKPINDLKRHF